MTIGNYGMGYMPMPMNNFNSGMTFNGSSFTPQFDFTIHTGGSSTTSSGSSKSSSVKSSDEDIVKMRQELIELQNQAKNDPTVTALADKKKAIEAGKNEDGTANVKDTRKCKDVDLKEKLMSVGGSMLKGGFNIAKGLVGYGSDGKWHWQNLVRNAVVAGAILACPAIGGALAAGGWATAGAIATAVPTVMTYLGLATGVCLVGKGGYDMYKAETMAELDTGAQEVGAGVGLVIATRKAAKKMLSAKVASAGNNATGSTLSKFWQGCQNESQAFGQQITTSINNANGNKLLGFLKATKAEYWTKGGAEAQKGFEKQQSEFMTKATSTKAEIDARISTMADGAEKTALQKQSDAIETIMNQVNNAKTKGAWKIINKNTGDLPKDIASQLSELKAGRFSSMLKMAQRGGDQGLLDEVQQFGYNKSSYSKFTSDLWYSHWIKNCTLWQKTKTGFMDLMFVGGTAMCPAFVGAPYQGHSTMQGANVVQLFDPVLESGEELTAEQYKEQLAALDQQIKTSEDSKKQMQDLISKSFSDPAAFKREYQALAQAQAQAQAQMQQAQAQAQQGQQVATA